jgi:very-short-patch-repair endonuclease
MRTFVHPQLLMRARNLRKNMTETEKLLWAELRRCATGLRFRKQHPVDGAPYVLDFYAPSAKLAVEVDGAVHRGQQERDAARDAWLSRLGIRVVRIPVSLVARDVAAAVAVIRRAR